MESVRFLSLYQDLFDHFVVVVNKLKDKEISNPRDAHKEIEIRLGTAAKLKGNNSFTPNISETDFERMIAQLTKSNVFRLEELTETDFTIPTNTTTKERVTLNSNGSYTNIYKERLLDSDVYARPCLVFDIRISGSVETTIRSRETGQGEPTEWTCRRIKHRKRFKYHNNQFFIDLTEVNQTIRQNETSIRREIEIEWADFSFFDVYPAKIREAFTMIWTQLALLIGDPMCNVGKCFYIQPRDVTAAVLHHAKQDCKQLALRTSFTRLNERDLAELRSGCVVRARYKGYNNCVVMLTYGEEASQAQLLVNQRELFRFHDSYAKHLLASIPAKTNTFFTCAVTVNAHDNVVEFLLSSVLLYEKRSILPTESCENEMNQIIQGFNNAAKGESLPFRLVRDSFKESDFRQVQDGNDIEGTLKYSLSPKSKYEIEGFHFLLKDKNFYWLFPDHWYINYLITKAKKNQYSFACFDEGGQEIINCRTAFFDEQSKLIIDSIVDATRQMSSDESQE